MSKGTLVPMTEKVGPCSLASSEDTSWPGGSQRGQGTFLGSLMSPSPQWHLPPASVDGAKNGTWVRLILTIFQSHLGCSDLSWVMSL